MDFELSQEQSMLRDSVSRFIREEYGFAERQALVKSPLGYCDGHWNTFAQMGWLGLPLAEADGGMGGTVIDSAILAEATGPGMLLEPLLSTVHLGARLVAALGSDAQRARILPDVAEGRVRLALAHGEPAARHRLDHVETTAETNGDGHVLNGRKSVVLQAASADWILVVARSDGAVSDPDGLSVFLVAGDAKGLRRQDYRLVDGQPASDLWLENVSGELLGGGAGSALPALQAVIDDAICISCAEAVGAMTAVLDLTREYVGTRRQFGRAIGDNQVIQHRLVDMFTAREEAKAMTDVTAMRLAEGDAGAHDLVAATKAKVGECARFVGAQGVQLHGGIGMTDAYPVGHYYKRLMAFDVLFGDAAWHLGRYADTIR